MPIIDAIQLLLEMELLKAQNVIIKTSDDAYRERALEARITRLDRLKDELKEEAKDGKSNSEEGSK